MPNLRSLQRRFFEAVTTTPGGGQRERFAPGLLRDIVGRGELDASARVGIYADMYFVRILEALAEDFRCVRATLGTAAFRDLVAAYLTHHPSTHPSLRYVGRDLPTFLTTQASCGAHPHIADLARLEWTRLEVFDAPDAEPLTLAQVRAIPPSDWSELRFRLTPALRVLRCAWPVHEIWSESELDPERLRSWQPAQTLLRVWRQDFKVFQASMDALEERALMCLRSGETFAAICEQLDPALSPEAAAREAGALLARWLEDGILLPSR